MYRKSYVSKNVWRVLRLPVSAFALVAQKSFNGEFTANNWFSDQTFYVTIANFLSMKVLSLSIHCWISIWTTSWWNLNKIIWYEIDTKALIEKLSSLIVQKNYGCRTRVIRLRGYCTPGQFWDRLCIFVKNYKKLVTSKVCFL